MKFTRLLNPFPGLMDFVQEFRRAQPYRWRIAALSAASTAAIFSLLWREEMIGPPPRPDITYISTFAPGRSQAEIIASNIANQRIKDRLAAEQAERTREVQGIYRKLGQMSGMDVDKIEREAAAERAAEENAKAIKQVKLKGDQVAGNEPKP